MDKCCPVSKVVASTSVRVTSLLKLSNPRAWTSVVQAVSVKLSRENKLLVLKMRYNVSGEGSLFFLQLSPFLTVGECIEDRCYILSIATGLCDARAILLRMCHSWSGHILEL